MDHFRHRNGNAKIVGLAEVCKSTFADKDSFISGEGASVFASEIINSKIFAPAEIIHSHLTDCFVNGYPGSTVIISNAILHRTQVSHKAKVLGAIVTGSFVLDEAVVKGDAVKVSDSLIMNKAVVEGAAIVRNLAVHSEMRIGFGEWINAPPRYHEIVNQELDVLSGITESVDGTAYVGCTRKPMRDWQRKAKLWGKIAGWTDAMVKELYQVFECWQDCKNKVSGA